MTSSDPLFDVTDKVAVITGGTGVLCGEMAKGLAERGAKVAILGRNLQKAQQSMEQIRPANSTMIALAANVLHQQELEAARETILQKWGRIDILINGAGGNMPGATIQPDQNFFDDLNLDTFRQVVDLNFEGTVLPTLVFGKAMAEHRSGSIINISSMAATQAITRVVGYASAKAAVDAFTRWLAVELARKIGEGLRVNAIAPGFFITEQNRELLSHPDGSLTERGAAVVRNTPAGRLGQPEELVGACIWLCSDASRFVTGTVVVVDGGFSAWSGV